MLTYIPVLFLLLQVSQLRANGFRYVVETKTGSGLWEGTDSDVFIEIHGTQKQKTSEHELATSRDDFERGSLDKFTFDDPVDVGVPDFIKMYRTDTVGGGWKLNWVKVTYGGKEFVYNYNKMFPKKTWVTIRRECSPGFKPNPSGPDCIDIDECATMCRGSHSRCENSIGSYRCICHDGFELRNHECYDIDECKGNHGCDQKCVNTPGSYRCKCESGYTSQGLACINKNECDTKPCRANTDCVDNIGSYQCVCRTGFERSDIYSCKDINECLTSHKCDFKVSSCENTQGGYSCNCNKGFKKTSKYGCADINECTEGDYNICDSTSSTCSNLAGGFYCNCKPGYHQGNNNKLCAKDACGPLAVPYQSVLSPPRCSTSNFFGDKCTITCNQGYKLEDAYAQSMTCGIHGHWSGKIPRCVPVICPPLGTLLNGRLLPSTCSTAGGKYQGQCTYLCNSGYQRDGSPLRECQADRTWTASKPKCVKVVAKPSIRCPMDIGVDLAPGQKTADVSAEWKNPTYTGAVLTVDPLSASAKFPYPAGRTKITWTVKNSAGTDSCSILVIVNDKQPPKVSGCPSSPVATLTTSTSAQVTWSVPTFTDNVGVTKVTSTHNSGAMFGIGAWNVYYTASDAAGNRVGCQFEVIVKRKGCPVLESPIGGEKKCQKFGPSFFCTILCPNGQQIYKNPSPFSFWTCSNGAWSPTPKIPDCVAATLNSNGDACTGNQVKMTIKNSVGTKQYCANCPTGTFSSNGVCLPCVAGQYQDQQGSSACKPCPSGTSSLGGAYDAKQCRVVCRPGHFSKDGMDPGCQLCPRDTYQDQAQATSCKTCPQGTQTLSAGRASMADCGVKPSISSLKPANITIDERQSTAMSCLASGSPAPTLKLAFRKSFKPEYLGKETRAYLRDSNNKIIGIKLTITDATYENSGYYECTAENAFGKAMKLASLTVNKVYGSGGGASLDEELLF